MDKMKLLDLLLTLLPITLVILHLLIAPYTKVEESFNIQAIHDLVHWDPKQSLSSQHFDHFSFPGAVPRTFVGAFLLSWFLKPISYLFNHLFSPESSGRSEQILVRGILGSLNAGALISFKNGLDKNLGKDVGRWYILLQATQFHVIFYASRTLPNMFAFALTTYAFRAALPFTRPRYSHPRQPRPELFIYLLVSAAIVFRSEIALLLATYLASLLLQSRISIPTILIHGIQSALLSLFVSVPLDSYLWRRPIWPEFAGFYYNAIEGKSSDWGISPYPTYFTSLLPKLLLNPLIPLLLIPLSLILPSTKFSARNLVLPSQAFVAIYSIQPHKEARFIIYIVPPLTAAASLSASYIWTRRTKSLLYTFGSLLLAVSILGTFVASTGMLLISSLNYPGGHAVERLHTIISSRPPSTSNQPINIHLDVLSCMTGVTQFLQSSNPSLKYDKTENQTTLLEPAFWSQFDYALMSKPERAIGKWEVLDTVYAYAGIEVLRPGDGSKFGEKLGMVYEANNLTEGEGEEERVRGSENIREAVERAEGARGKIHKEKDEKEDTKLKVLFEEVERFGTWKLVRDMVRSVTGGWWIGPRMEPAIRVLKRVKD